MDQGRARDAALRLANSLGFTFVEAVGFDHFKAYLTTARGEQLWACDSWVEAYHLILGFNLGLSHKVQLRPMITVVHTPLKLGGMEP